jgi:hypothetical protein
LLCKEEEEESCSCEMQRSEKRMQTGRIFCGRLKLEKDSFANDDEDDDKCFKIVL